MRKNLHQNEQLVLDFCIIDFQNCVALLENIAKFPGLSLGLSWWCIGCHLNSWLWWEEGGGRKVVCIFTLPSQAMCVCINKNFR